jgi:phytoene dehydrogenase-like protein
MAETISIVGGGIGGLVAAITCAEQGADVRLFEVRRTLGGRARTTDGPFRANLGGHVLYDNGAAWRWLRARKLVPAARRSPVTGVRFLRDGHVRRLPPRDLVRGVLRLRGQPAPSDVDFRTWATSLAGASAAELLARAAGVFTFHHDPGQLSAAFLAERGRQVLSLPPANRYVVGGWDQLVQTLARRARQLGVAIHTATRVRQLPPPPVIIATAPRQARLLLGEPDLRVDTTRCIVLDLGLRSRRGDPFLVSDLDGAGWVERYSAADPSLAPKGHDLVQAHTGVRPSETDGSALSRLERALDAGFPGWREREVWRRRLVMNGMTGAIDLPGRTWRDRPAIGQRQGVFVAGDWVAAPGLLSDVTFASAATAADLALQSTHTAERTGA